MLEASGNVSGMLALFIEKDCARHVRKVVVFGDAKETHLCGEERLGERCQGLMVRTGFLKFAHMHVLYVKHVAFGTHIWGTVSFPSKRPRLIHGGMETSAMWGRGSKTLILHVTQ